MAGGHIKFSAIIETASALANLNRITEDHCCKRLISLEIGKYYLKINVGDTNYLKSDLKQSRNAYIAPSPQSSRITKNL